MFSYYKSNVERLSGLENREIFHFGQMDVDNDEVIIKRKSWDEAAYRNDVHTAKIWILLGFLGNVRYMMVGYSK